MCFFKKKRKIVDAIIISYNEGISDGDALTNLASGHMMSGFDGMVHASLLNESQGPTVTFQLCYDDGSIKNVTVDYGGIEYRFYINYVK